MFYQLSWRNACKVRFCIRILLRICLIFYLVKPNNLKGVSAATLAMNCEYLKKWLLNEIDDWEQQSKKSNCFAFERLVLKTLPYNETKNAKT